MRTIAKTSTMRPEYMSDAEINLLTRAEPDVHKALQHRRKFLTGVYRDNSEFRSTVCDRWITHSHNSMGQRLKDLLRSDNQPGSNKEGVSRQLALVRVQAEVMVADNETFRAIWDPLPNGLSSMVSRHDKETGYLKKLYGNDDASMDAIVSAFEVPFITAAQHNDRLEQMRKNAANKPSTALEKQPVTVATSKCYTNLGSCRNDIVSPAVQTSHKHTYTDSITEIQRLRIRAINKHGCYINLLKSDVVTAGISALYHATSAATKALPSNKSKAQSIESLIGLIRKRMVTDGTWDDVEKLKKIVAVDQICTLPESLRGVDAEKNLLAPATVRLAKGALEKSYHPWFEEHIKCPEGHFVSFYSGQSSSSIVSCGSQMVNFGVEIHGHFFTSLEQYYQLRKHATLGFLQAKDEFAGIKFLKASEKPTSTTNDMELTDAEWETLRSEDIHSGIAKLFDNKKCTGKKARLIAKCMEIDTGGVGLETASKFLELLAEDLVQTLIDGNWVKFQTVTYKSLLLMTGTAVIVEACPNHCDCKCGIACDDHDFYNDRKKYR